MQSQKHEHDAALHQLSVIWTHCSPIPPFCRSQSKLKKKRAGQRQRDLTVGGGTQPESRTGRLHRKREVGFGLARGAWWLAEAGTCKPGIASVLPPEPAARAGFRPRPARMSLMACHGPELAAPSVPGHVPGSLGEARCCHAIAPLLCMRIGPMLSGTRPAANPWAARGRCLGLPDPGNSSCILP